MQVTQLLTVAVVGATIGGEESVGPGFQPRHDDCDGCPGAVVVMLLGLLSTVDGREVGAGGGVEVLGPPVVVLFLNSLPRLEECSCSFVVLGVVGQRRGCLKRRIWAGDEKLALLPNSLPLRLEGFSCSFAVSGMVGQRWEIRSLGPRLVSVGVERRGGGGVLGTPVVVFCPNSLPLRLEEFSCSFAVSGVDGQRWEIRSRLSGIEDVGRRWEVGVNQGGTETQKDHVDFSAILLSPSPL